MRLETWLLAAVLFAATPAAAQSTDIDVAEGDIEEAIAASNAGAEQDPWEGFNRKMFAVHTALDDALLVPAAQIYRATTPPQGRRGIKRFLANLRTPVTLINDLLQGEFRRAGETASRFVINSTIGAGGFADPASQLGIEGHTEDFGQTLAVWGVDSGPFLFLPLLGPSTLRDASSLPVNIASDPLFYIRTPPANISRYTRAGISALAVREPLIEPLDDIRDNSLDYYASFRSFYLQARKREINNGRTDFEDLPDIGDFEEFDELD